MGKIPTRSPAVQILDISNTTIIRKKLSQCVGKICAYHNVGKFDDAKAWAHTLTKELKRYGLMP